MVDGFVVLYGLVLNRVVSAKWLPRLLIWVVWFIWLPNLMIVWPYLATLPRSLHICGYVLLRTHFRSGVRLKRTNGDGHVMHQL